MEPCICCESTVEHRHRYCGSCAYSDEHRDTRKQDAQATRDAYRPTFPRGYR